MASIDLSTSLARPPSAASTTGPAPLPAERPEPAAGGPAPAAPAPDARAREPVGANREPRPDPDLDAAVSQLNDLIQNIRRELQFAVDEDSGQTVITVIDVETRQVVRQIPPQEVTRIIQSLAARNTSLTAGMRA